MHDQTAVKTEGIEELFRQYPSVTARVDTGYRGLAKAFPDRVCAPTLPPAKDAPAEEIAAHKQAGKQQSSQRTCVEHAIAEHKQWRPLQRYLGRRDAYPQDVPGHRLHPYHTERILTRSNRAALPPAAAAREVEAAAHAGRLDPERARAVIEAAGQQPARARSAWPEGLSEREVDVLRLVARGLSNRQIAAALVISPRTAEHHVQHIYAKIGASTRAAAAMFSMEHGLLR